MVNVTIIALEDSSKSQGVHIPKASLYSSVTLADILDQIDRKIDR